MIKPKFAITIGDPNGIGPEIVIKALLNHPQIYDLCHPVIFGDANIIKSTADILRCDINLQEIDVTKIKESNSDTMYCHHIQPEVMNLNLGNISPEGGQHAYAYLKEAINMAKENKIKSIITAPINKESLRSASVPFLDHTEILQHFTSSEKTMTLFIVETLRIFFYSRHIPFNKISSALEQDKIVETLTDCIAHLQKIGISKPKIALAALNPHGGEGGMFGSEEIEILGPAVSSAKQKGLEVEGPIPADSVFNLTREGFFDAVLSLYHDQGHIAAKTYDFYRTVSLTMGLPFLRASVDHGTAFDIAGKGIANEVSLVEAIKTAHKYYW
jgi:4-hydroxythreonine-4-phosphate dehydrogenase